MSELMNASAAKNAIRGQLFTTTSVLAVLGAMSAMTIAQADEENDRPTIWIELGGQLSRLDQSQEAFSPPLMDGRPSIFLPSAKFEKLPLNSIEESGKISFEPENSDWIFSASVRYGRAVSHVHVRQKTSPAAFITYFYNGFSNHRYAKYPAASKFADTLSQNSEHHLIVDFQAGKDVGLGMFGGASSILSLGVRFAQFGTGSHITLRSDPNWKFQYGTLGTHHLPLGSIYNSNVATLVASRSFHGIGPSLSWNASVPLMDNGQASRLTLDWGLNAAVLFGRQRTKVRHQATGQYHGYKYGSYDFRKTVYHPQPFNTTRARNVTVPNIGGFAGFSFRYADAKVSFGYRADLFFHAMDGGIETRKSENVGFFGPFANISVGIGG